MRFFRGLTPAESALSAKVWVERKKIGLIFRLNAWLVSRGVRQNKDSEYATSYQTMNASYIRGMGEISGMSRHPPTAQAVQPCTHEGGSGFRRCRGALAAAGRGGAGVAPGTAERCSAAEVRFDADQFETPFHPSGPPNTESNCE